jgi:hypothetical protein
MPNVELPRQLRKNGLHFEDHHVYIEEVGLRSVEVNLLCFDSPCRVARSFKVRQRCANRRDCTSRLSA